MTKEASFLQPVVKDSKTSTTTKSTAVNNEVKTTPSLFDSLLNGANKAQDSATSKDMATSTTQTSTKIQENDNC